jgi:hypothetical protein
MINTESSIQCPVCGTKIPFEIKSLLSGISFTCPNPECNSSIGLAPESTPIVEQTMEKLESLKKSSKQKI